VKEYHIVDHVMIVTNITHHKNDGGIPRRKMKHLSEISYKPEELTESAQGFGSSHRFPVRPLGHEQ